MKIILGVLLCISLLFFAEVAAAEGQWMIAQNTLSLGEGRPAGQPTEDSVLIWNPSPLKGETVEWFGGREHDPAMGVQSGT